MLRNLLHARGGVSLSEIVKQKTYTIFSTHVEVFLKHLPTPTAKNNLLHARGGVSSGMPVIKGKKKSSPRTWRCFHSSQNLEVSFVIFSTHVEVFLCHLRHRPGQQDLLHARGGVS